MNVYYKRLIDKYDVISFDVFDTLISRNDIEPERMLKKVGGIAFDGTREREFVQKRMKAEKMARSNGKEVTLDDIYTCMDEEFVQIKEIEREYEFSNCYRRKKGYELYQYAIENNKKVILVSDMYLQATDMQKILARCGYTKYEKIFVSNEYATDKVCGGLYKYVGEYVKTLGGTLVHMGDSIRGDVCGAKKGGVKSVLLLREKMLYHFIFRCYAKWILR